MVLDLCICKYIPKLEVDCRLTLVIQQREIRKPTNTGALAALSLANSRIIVRGAEDNPIDYAQICEPNTTHLLLFPGEGAQLLSTSFCNQLQKPLNLIVPDGNWNQASRMARRIVAAAPVQCVVLPEGNPSVYQLRREPERRPEGMATIEAIARAYGIIESPDVENQLMELFLRMRDRMLYRKGRMNRQDIFGGID